MSYGEVRHTSRKVRKAALRVRVGGKDYARKVKVEVYVGRSEQVAPTGRLGPRWSRYGYTARACIARGGKSWGSSRTRRVMDRCGDLGHGSTPSKAINKALVKLAQVRK